MQMSTKQTERLVDVRGKGINALKELSKRLNDEQSIVDCENILGLEPEEMEALFHSIRSEWYRRQELQNFISIKTLDSNLLGQISEYISNSTPKSNAIKVKNSFGFLVEHEPIKKRLLFFPVGLILVIAFIFLLPKHSFKNTPDTAIKVAKKSSFTTPLLETKRLIIGILGDVEKYAELESYLKQKFGAQVQIQFEGSSTTDYQKSKNKIASQELDIVFTLSPMISIAAKDNGYTWAAKMFPDKPPFYQSVLFVRADSKIRNLEDSKPDTVIALGDFNSASSFYMPSYTFYGKQLTVNRGNRGSKIIELVKTGKADVGATAYIDTNDLEFRIINTSRNIPGAGVYLSPKLSMQDRKIIKDVLLEAPPSVRDPKKANYGVGEEPDYSQFRSITNRVESMLTCVDWKQKIISFYCPEQKVGITGVITDISPSIEDPNQARIKLQINNDQVYRILLPLSLINQIPGGGSLLNLKNKQVRLIDTQSSKGSDGKLEIKIDRASQIKLLN
jgi:ABC-type phosphate/phosphonate transport system substrate-binding protein